MTSLNLMCIPINSIETSPIEPICILKQMAFNELEAYAKFA